MDKVPQCIYAKQEHYVSGDIKYYPENQYGIYHPGLYVESVIFFEKQIFYHYKFAYCKQYSTNGNYRVTLKRCHDIHFTQGFECSCASACGAIHVKQDHHIAFVHGQIHQVFIIYRKKQKRKNQDSVKRKKCNP